MDAENNNVIDISAHLMCCDIEQQLRGVKFTRRERFLYYKSFERDRKLKRKETQEKIVSAAIIRAVRLALKKDDEQKSS